MENTLLPIINLIQEYSLFLWKITYGLVCLLTIGFLLRAWVGGKDRRWESFYFLWLCFAVLVWSGCSLLNLMLPSPQAAEIFLSLRYLGIIFVPGLLCLHVWKQVSYKDITPTIVLSYLGVPILLTLWIIIGLPAERSVLPFLTDAPISWEGVLFAAYTAVMIIRSYLLCFNVFYQMPRHMRRSTYYMLFAISAVTILFFAHFLLERTPIMVMAPIAVIVMMLCLLDAFSALSSANVIVTSRDLVFGSISTVILVLSRSMQVLDWNKKGPLSIDPLPKPVYKEPYRQYLERVLREGEGRVSPHDENIITTMRDGVERHYLLTTHEVKRRKRRYGYLVEISEVTRIYSVIRYLGEIAIVDQLTGLYNRNAYLSMVRQLVYPDQMPLIVVVGDVNNLKHLNDTRGHLVGDALLITSAGLMRDSAPEDAFLARIGGDEFVLLLPNSDIQAAIAFTEEVNCRCVAMNHPEFGKPSISWGWAVMENADQDYNEIFAKADQIMYDKKKEHFRFRSSGLVPPLAPLTPVVPPPPKKTPVENDEATEDTSIDIDDVEPKVTDE